ncbi:fibrocystin-L [Astyanax mexicanus]|uniref:Fibrocystin-L n=1 Tax=Astyanax mexicanus TaxID=7994 RepID=A0A8T2KJG5_ASTMX|nr:fibrocystin-L [Astyanax mexicanus]
MDCDGKKKSLLVDLDGTLLGSVGAVVPQSEYEWNGDPRHGVGDYRIPKVMLTALNGSRIPVSQIAPNKGVIRDSSCTYMSSWQAYKCFSMNYRMLVIESLDSDSETRRLSPVAVLGSGYIDLLNGPQDHGWCSGYTCQKRVSLFHSIVATNKSYDVFFTSTSPQKLRLMLLNAKPTESVVVAVFYSNPQRLDVYVNKQLVAPTNAQWNAQRTDYTLLEPTYTGQYVPKLSSLIGSNFFDPDYKMLYVLVQGSTPVEIRTSPVLFIAFNLPAMTEAEFFGDTLVANLAAFLRVPTNMIRISKIIREGSARRRRAAGLTVQVAIQQPPTIQTTTNSTSDVEQFQVLKNITDNLGQAAVTGSLSQSIGFNVSSMGVVPPSPPPSDPSWSTVADQTVTREDPVVQTVRSVSSLTVVVEPVAGYNPGPLFTQPSIMAVDQQGECVSVGVTTLTITAVLKDTRGNEVDGLYGNTTIPFSSCWANYTDLAISTTGENMTLAFTLNNWMTQSRSFTVKSVPSTVSATADSSSTTATTSIPGSTTDGNSVFDSSPALKIGTVYTLMLLSVLHLLYCVL